jgi:hypothetical protein
MAVTCFAMVMFLYAVILTCFAIFMFKDAMGSTNFDPAISSDSTYPNDPARPPQSPILLVFVPE